MRNCRFKGCGAIHRFFIRKDNEQGYKYPHSYPNHWVRQQYLPDALRGARYYDYGDNKIEQAAKKYWDEIKK